MPNNLAQFEKDLTRFTTKVVPERLIEAKKKIAFDVLNSVVRKTPVDKGRARASWNVSVNRVDLKVEPKRKSKLGEAAATARATSKYNKAIGEVQAFDVIYLSNNLPYILALENGSSSQAPRGMVKVALAEVKTGLGI